MSTAQQLIAHFQLEALPVEGGLFRQTYRAADTVETVTTSARYNPNKPAGTAILALFTDQPDSFSAMHRLASDEIWHFYLGDPIDMLLLHPKGVSQQVTLGPDVLHSQYVQLVVRRGVWMGARLRLGGAYALFGNTMAPGFTSADYEGGEREALIAQYPQEAPLITRLTRPHMPVTRMPDGL